MAKAKSALGLWKGSTKSKTFSVLYGEQIIRDKAESVANPQTTSQMYVRVAFGTVAKAGAVLHDLIGISFQGYKSIAKSKRRFNALNISKLQKQVRSNAADGQFAPKGLSVLVPNKYIIADGSLRNASLGTITMDPQNDGMIQSAHVFQLEKGVTYTASEIIDVIFGCLPGDQVTIVGIRSGIPVESKSEEYQILRDGEMVSVRAFFKSATELADIPDFTIAAASTPTEVSTQLQAYLTTLFKEGYAPLISLLTAAAGYVPTAHTGSDTLLDFSWTVKKASGNAYEAFDGIFGVDDVVAVNYFRSSYREQSKLWMFSRCALVLLEPIYDQATYETEAPVNYGYTFGVALPSYIKQASRESVRYTETGGAKNTLGF